MPGFVPDPPPPPTTDTSVDEVQRVDEVCDRFEADWNAGARRDVDGYLQMAPETVRPVLRRELLALAEELRCRDGVRTEFEARMPRAGDVVGDYLILEHLAQGGMGWVYKAMQQRMRRVVALKVPSCDGRLLTRRFLREVRIAAQLTHPNVVIAYDAGESAGRAYLALEFVDGTDLARRVRDRGPLAPAEAIDAAEQAARGLAAAHRLGIVHRDVKPSNLIRGADGVVKVLDLGLARPAAGHAGPSTELTVDGALLGTVDYMAPEQALDSRRCDARTDIYALGCTLFYLLTGRPPYDGATTMERLLAHRQAPVASPRAVRPDVPEPLDALVRRMIAKDPSHRPDSMDAVIAALRDVRAAPDAPEPPRSGRRRALAWCAVAAVVVTVLVVAALARRDSPRDSPRPPAAPAALAPADAASVARRVAERTIQLGGAVVIKGGGEIKELSQLPAGPFQLEWLDLRRNLESLPRSNTPVGDAELALFDGLKDLNQLHLGGTAVTDEGLARLRSVTGLGHLFLIDTKVTDRGLAALADFPRLVQVILMRTAVTDDGMAALARCRSLRYLNLDSTSVTSAGLARLRPLEGLLTLDLDDTKVGDQGLDALLAFRDLERLSLARTPVTDASLGVLTRLPALRYLSLEGNPGVTDGALADLERLTGLQELVVTSTSLSAAGLARLRAALPSCQVRPGPG